ncbi:hypothetical protein L6R52_18575 [Myxococcota bacterium]|nr:hypothetical protein [Myxococcota bacterium]
MRSTRRLPTLLLAGAVVLGLGGLAYAADVLDPRGEPKIEVGKRTVAWTWSDATGVHVRWTSNGTPALFTGEIELDATITEMKRVNPRAGGWMERTSDRAIEFSVTATAGVDGAIIEIPGRPNVKIDLQIDGKPAEVSQIVVGQSAVSPKELPLKYRAAK